MGDLTAGDAERDLTEAKGRRRKNRSRQDRSVRAVPGAGVPEQTRGGGGFGLFRKRAAFYVDGFNLYHAIEMTGYPHLHWLDLRQLAKSILPKDQVLKRTTWCSAFRPGNRAQLLKHEAYFDALSMTGVICHLGHFVTAVDGCNACGHSWNISFEKQSDINLALAVAADAEDDRFDVCYILSTDGDQGATARYIKTRFPKKKVVSVVPPGRMHNRHVLAYCDAKVTLSLDDLHAALLPAQIKVGKTRLARPTAYDPPVEIKRVHLTLVHSK